jgi:hypothetical protein
MYWPEPAQYLAGRHNLWIPSYNSMYEKEHINYVAWSGSWSWSAGAAGPVSCFNKSFYVTIELPMDWPELA